MPSNKISQLIHALEEGSCDERAKVLRDLCPCRNDIQDIHVWQKVFRAAHQPGTRVRGQAIHAIATLLQRAKTSGRWRAVLKDLAAELDKVLSDPEACKLLRRQVQHDAKAEGDLTPAAHCKKLRRIVELNTPHELADWVNELIGQRPPGGVNAHHPGLVRLWRWHQHRINFQPERRTDAKEFLKKAQRWLPEYFQDANVELEKLEFSRPQPKAKSEMPPPELSQVEPQEEALGCLESSNPKRRVRGLKRLAQMKVPELFDWCLMFLEDESKDVRVVALQGMINCDEIDPSILEAFVESDDVRIRAAAIAALARHGGGGAARWYEQGLKDPSACVRLETAALLGYLDRDANRSLFEIALHDPNPSVVHFAQKSAT